MITRFRVEQVVIYDRERYIVYYRLRKGLARLCSPTRRRRVTAGRVTGRSDLLQVAEMACAVWLFDRDPRPAGNSIGRAVAIRKGH